MQPAGIPRSDVVLQADAHICRVQGGLTALASVRSGACGNVVLLAIARICTEQGGHPGGAWCKLIDVVLQAVAHLYRAVNEVQASDPGGRESQEHVSVSEM